MNSNPFNNSQNIKIINSLLKSKYLYANLLKNRNTLLFYPPTVTYMVIFGNFITSIGDPDPDTSYPFNFHIKNPGYINHFKSLQVNKLILLADLTEIRHKCLILFKS